MKTRNLALLFLLILMQASTQKSSISPDLNITSPQATIDTDLQVDEPSVSKPVEADAALNPLPTNSIYEDTIEQMYGATGLNIPEDDFLQIKNCYCYLEFLIKCGKVKNDKSLSQYTDDFKNFLQPPADGSTLMPTQILVESNGWKSIPVTAQDFVESPAWQLFVKAMICDTLSNDAESIEDFASNQNLMSPYIPNMETGYYNSEFTSLRLYQESMQLESLRNSQQRKRYLAQCSDWKNISYDKIMDTVAQFKKTDFYTLTHTPPQPTDTNTTKKSKKKPKIPVITSPTREHILCYFMLVRIQTNVYNSITEGNAESMINTASSDKLSPNFFLYNISDLVYINDSFALQQLTEIHKSNPNALIFGPTAVLISQASATSNSTTAPSNPTSNQQAPQALASNSDPTELQKQAATLVFEKIPAISQYAQAINKIYGKSGLNIPVNDLSNIKKTYCYLEFLAKLNKVLTDKKFAQYKTDFKDYLEPNKDGTAFLPTDALVASAGWKAITITDQDLMKTPTWHNFVKAMICDCYDSNKDFILENQEINNHIIAYTPLIDTEYKTAEFTQFRLYAESLQLNQIIRTQQQKQYLEICPDWEKLGPIELYTAIANFKKTDFYTLTHDMPDQVPDPKGSNKYTNASLDLKNQILGYYLLITIQVDISAMMTVENVASFLDQASSSILSPNFFTYTPADFMYFDDFLLITRLTNTNNAVLDTAPDSDEIIVTANTIDTNKDDEAEEDNDDDEDDEDIDDDNEDATSQDTVVIQKVKNPFTAKNFDPKRNGIARSIKKTNRDSARALDPKRNGMNKSIKKTNKKTARAHRRQAVRMKRIQRKQAAGMKRENRRIAKAMKKNQKIICAVFITVAIAIAVAVLCCTGVGATLAGPLIMMGQMAVSGVMGAATAIGGAVVGTVTSVGAAGAAIAGAASAGFVAGSAAGGIAGGIAGAIGGVSVLGITTAGALGASAFVAATTTITGALTAVAVAGGVSVGIAAMADPKFKAKLMKEVMLPIMQGMEKMTDAMTTGLIEMSVGFTAMGAGFAQAIGYPVNMKHEMNKVRAKMEKYRSTINVINSIVLTVLMTLAVMAVTAGAGAAYNSMAAAGYFGETAAASASAAAATTAASGQVAAKASLDLAIKAETAATAAAKQGVQSGVKAGAQKALEKQALAATTKRLATEKAAQKATEYSAQMSIKAAARQEVATAAKGLATKKAEETAAQIALKNAADDGVRGVLQPKLAAATAERQAAEFASKQATEKLAQTTAKLNADQAASVAARQASSKTASYSEKISSSMGRNQIDDFGRTASQRAADKNAAKLAEKANKLGAQQAKEAAGKKMSLKIAAKNAETNAVIAEQNAAKLVANGAANAQEAQVAATAARAAANQAAEKVVINETMEASITNQAAAFSKDYVTSEAYGFAAQQAEKSAADKTLADLASKEAAEQAAKTQAELALKKSLALQAKNDAAKTAADDLLRKNIAREAKAIMQRKAADASAQKAASFAASNLDDAAAQIAAKEAEELVAQSLAKEAAATIAKKETQELVIQTTTKQALAKSTVQASEQSLATVLSRKTSQELAEDLVVATAAEEATAIATKNTADATAKKAIELAAKNPDDAAKQIAAKKAEEAAEQAAIKQTTATANRKTAEQGLIKNATKTADDAAENLLVTASKISQKETERLGGRTLMQKANEESIWSAVKGGVMSGDFILGQALNATFGVFSAMAAVAQDEAAADLLESEKKSIQSLWQYVEDSKVNVVQEQGSFLDELHKKHQVAVENQVMGLQYYNNFLHSSVVNVQDQIAQALAQQYIQLLTPDSNGLRTSDIGSTWGLQTAFTYLYPSQGFISTTLGRPDFPYAQEIAQAPLASESQSVTTDISDKEPQATKLWFNQRAVSVLKQAVELPLNVEIKFRVIYNLTTAYHVGLYLGGNYHDYNSPAYLQSIQDSGTIDLNDAHLAKMLVLKRDNKDATPSISLYEHEGKGWISQDPVDANILNSASIYHMQASLNKDQLTVSFWTEDNSSQKWTKATTVNPCDQRTFGVIFSGIAIEWNVVRPGVSITQNKKARAASNGKSEINRERASKAQWKDLLNPKFGSMELQSPGRPALLQGQYLYTTQSTSLTDAQGNPINDYVVFANSVTGNITNIGNSPSSFAKASAGTAAGTATSSTPSTPNVILSLITGNVYDNSGKVIARKQNALQAYTQNKPIAQKLSDAISQAGQMYQQQLLHYTFGSYQLSAASEEAIDQGLFIYTCGETITQQDADGNPILDYLVMADIVDGSLGSTIGMPPSSATQGMVSLITGNVYAKDSATPIDSGYSEMAQYTKQYGPLPQEVSGAITAASHAYNNTATTPANSKEVVIDATTSSQSISLSDLLNAAPPKTGGVQVGLSSIAPSKIVATGSSISQLQNAAAGTAAIEFSGMGAVGLSFSDGAPTASTASPQIVSTENDMPIVPSALVEATIDDQENAVAPDATFALAGSSGFSL